MNNFGPCLLYAEDNILDQHMFTAAMEEAGVSFRVKFVNNGLEVLTYLRGEGEYHDRLAFPVPQIILLDAQMPKLNGFETLVSLKDEREFNHIPAILFSAHDDSETTLKAYKAGANAYVAKPLELPELIDLLTYIDAFWFRHARLP